MDELIGYRFETSDKKLIVHYLRPRVIEGRPFPCAGLIIERNLYGPQAEISDIFEEESRRSRYYEDDEDILYFFTPLNKKYETGTRICRIARSATWTGQDAGKEIKNSQGNIIGWKKQFTLTTNQKKRKISPSDCSWIMHEYSLPHDRVSNQLEYVLCRIRRKGKRSKRWEDEVLVPTAAAISNIAPPPPPSWTFSAPSMIHDSPSPPIHQSVMPMVNQQYTSYMPAIFRTFDAPPPSAAAAAAALAPLESIATTDHNQATTSMLDDDQRNYADSLEIALMEEDEEMDKFSLELNNMINNMRSARTINTTANNFPH